MLAAAPAHAINFNFQFRGVDIGNNEFVTGTLSGLVEGNNTGQGITATVISSPFGAGVTGTNFLYGFVVGSGLTVTGGNITFADAYLLYHPVLGQLWLGTPGNNGSSSIIYAGGYSWAADNNNSTTQFTAATSTPVPFESSPIALPASLAVCFGAAKLRRNHLAKKRIVSVEA